MRFAWLGIIVLLLAPGTWANEAVFPLEPANTNSPRDTLENLVWNITEADAILDSLFAELDSNPGSLTPREIREREREAIFLLNRAVGSLNISEVPLATRRFVVIDAALQLKEVIDRAGLPPLESIPDEQAVLEQGITRWRVPRTSMDIVLVEEGPYSGEFLFDPATVAQAGAMYRAVRHLPSVSRETQGMYENFISTPGRMLPPWWLEWVEDLPDWMHRVYYSNAVWQWIALVLTLLFTVSLPVQISRWMRKLRESDSNFVAALRRIVVPASALAALLLAEYFLVWQVNFTGQSLIILLKCLYVPIMLFIAHLAYLFVLLLTEGIITSPRIDTESLDAHMLRMIAVLVGGILGIGIIFYGADNIGVPVVPLIASLGVGGLAVALAARPTIENLIGGIILYIDRPVRVGDFCSFGEHRGTVENIGMRSIQLRARDRTIITVPNATFADMEIINWARCDTMQIHTTIGVRYETSMDQLRYLLVRIREMCLAHPMIDNERIRIRFIGYGDSSQDIGIRVYALTRDWNEYFAIKEDILLRVGEIVEQAGTGFAFPSRTVYFGRDEGIDTETGEKAAARVAGWRKAGELPFPNLTSSQHERLTDTLDYPPKGSPDSRESEAFQEQVAEPLSREPEEAAEPLSREPEQAAEPLSREPDENTEKDSDEKRDKKP